MGLIANNSQSVALRLYVCCGVAFEFENTYRYVPGAVLERFLKYVSRVECVFVDGKVAGLVSVRFAHRPSLFCVRRNESADLRAAGAVRQGGQRGEHAVRAEPGPARPGNHILVSGQRARVHGPGRPSVDPAAAGQRAHRMDGRAQEHAAHNPRQTRRLRQLHVHAHVRTISHHQRTRSKR